MTTVEDRIDAIGALLTEAEAAHGVYETTELQGVYDQEWPRWYATYVVEHGLAERLGHAVGADRLAAFLAGTFDEFRSVEPSPTEPWATWTARRITAEL